MNNKIVIIDFGMGNLFSIKLACESAGLKCLITDQKKDILEAGGVILPGVGAFGDAMAYLKKFDLIGPLKDFIDSGRPFLGICLGMQLLMSESEEFGRHKGLNIIQGSVVRFPLQSSQGEKIKVPQVGWNQIFPRDKTQENFSQTSPLKGSKKGEYMYFVHSFYVKPAEENLIVSLTDYEGTLYCSSLQKGNIFAAQFHPERSAKQGVQIYKNWALQVSSLKSIGPEKKYAVS